MWLLSFTASLMKMMIFLLAHDKLPRSLSTQVCDTDEECMLYCRYVSVQRYSEALDLLHSGACIQLERGQVNTLIDFNLFSFLVKCGEFKGLGYDNF